MNQLQIRFVYVAIVFSCALLGTFAGYGLISIYWQKGLPVPLSEFVWLPFCLLVSALISTVFFRLFLRTFHNVRFQLAAVSIASSALSLPTVVLCVHTVFTVLGGDTSIYFISESGNSILFSDIVLLVTVGAVFGGIVALAAKGLALAFGWSRLP